MPELSCQFIWAIKGQTVASRILASEVFMRTWRAILISALCATSALCFGSGPKQLAELTASDGTETDDFGASVAISGDTAVVGAPYATVGSNEYEGAAYVFVKPAGGWRSMTQVAKLTPSNGFSQGHFGFSVAVSGDTIVADGYVFVKPESGWTDMTETAQLGGTVCWAIEGNTIVTRGGNGVAYVYVKPKTGWTSGLEPTAAPSEAQPAEDGFGSSVAISKNTVVLGATGEFDVVDGAAYVFVKPAGRWEDMTQTAKLTASDGTTLDEFGLSIGISGGSIVVGAPYKTGNGPAYSGAAYVFVEPPGGWMDMTENAELTLSGDNYDSQLGFSVAVTGSKTVVGRPFNGNNENEGAAYLYKKPKSGWETTSQATTELLPSDPIAGNSFAISVAMSGGTVVVGASKLGQAPGAAYVF